MGMAPMAYVLWTRFLRHAPTRPDWPDRDRFVLSAGHASMLLYALLHLTGYDLPLDELERFRQWGSQTPGHPEYGLTPGVEATTGPLGQGVANASGWRSPSAASAADSTARATRSSTTGPSSSAPTATSGGHRLGGRVAGRPPPARQADRSLRRQPHPARRADRDGLQRGRPGPLRGVRLAHHSGSSDGNDLAAIEAAIDEALADERPSLIAVRTHIGYGSPNKQDSQKAHGSPLGPDEVRLTKEAYGWDPGPDLLHPRRGGRDVLAARSRAASRGPRSGRRTSRATARRSRPRRASSSGGSTATSAPARPTACRPTRPARTSPPARRARPRSRTSPGRCPSCSAAPPTCPSRT